MSTSASAGFRRVNAGVCVCVGGGSVMRRELGGGGDEERGKFVTQKNKFIYENTKLKNKITRSNSPCSRRTLLPESDELN